MTDDSCPQSLAAPNLATQLLDSGRTFTGYSEGLPRPGFTGCTDDLYARKHNPWVDFTNVPASANQPLTAMPRDYDTLPTVSIITPNLCHDMHYCPILVGDIWARRHLSPYVQWARTHDSMLIITFDEDNGTAANRIPTIVIGPMVRRTAATQQVDHYNVLRTVEEMYGLAPLARARGAQPITGIWVAGSLTPH